MTALYNQANLTGKSGVRKGVRVFQTQCTGNAARWVPLAGAEFADNVGISNVAALIRTVGNITNEWKTLTEEFHAELFDGGVSYYRIPAGSRVRLASTGNAACAARLWVQEPKLTYGPSAVRR